ncbi:MAG: glycosyltransferase family 9 protein, partial [Bacteroidota bacterium]
MRDTIFAAKFAKIIIRKILVIRFSSIGDILLTTPVVRCLQQQLGAEIHFLTKRAYVPLLEANPYISSIHTIEKKVSEVLPALRWENFDCIVDLHKNLRSWQVRMALGKKTLAFDKLNFEKWLLVNFKINRMPGSNLGGNFKLPPKLGTSIVDRYLAAVAPLGVKNDGGGLDFFFGAHLFESFKLSERFVQPPGFVAFSIGAAHQTKRLPTEKILAICQGISQPVVLLGGKQEASEGDLIARQAGAYVLNFCGKLTLTESAAVLRKASLVISHDTGMMHLAAAFQKKILSIWGSTVPEFGMFPYFGAAG